MKRVPKRVPRPRAERRGVAFVPDPLRAPITGLKAVTPTVLWFRGWIASALAELGIPERIVAPKSDGGDFPDAEILEAAGLPPSPDGWAGMTPARLTPDVLAVVKRWFRNEAVIGIIPLWLREALNRLGIPYVDHEFSPYRFTPDVLMSLATNHSAVADLLDAFQVDEEKIFSEAAKLKARADFESVDSAISGLRRPVVFFGQIDVDLALVANGKLISVESCIDSVERTLAPYDTVLVKLHPYAKTDAVAQTLARVRPIRIVRGPTYAILASERVAAVSALTSGTMKEARFFRKPALPILESDVARYNASSPKQYLLERVGHACFSSPILQGWLSGLCGLPRKLSAAEIKAAHRSFEASWARPIVRESCGLTWGNDAWGPITAEIYTRPDEADPNVCETAANPQGEISHAVGSTLNGPAYSYPLPHLRVGEILSFTYRGEGPRFVTSGGHTPDDTGVWMKARETIISVPIVEFECANRSLDVSLRLFSIPTPRHPARTLSVVAESGRTVGRARLDRPFERPVDLVFRLRPDDRLSAREITLKLTISDLINMRAEGINEDGRDLGACIAEMRLMYPRNVG